MWKNNKDFFVNVLLHFYNTFDLNLVYEVIIFCFVITISEIQVHECYQDKQIIITRLSAFNEVCLDAQLFLYIYIDVL